MSVCNPGPRTLGVTESFRILLSEFLSNGNVIRNPVYTESSPCASSIPPCGAGALPGDEPPQQPPRLPPRLSHSGGIAQCEVDEVTGSTPGWKKRVDVELLG